MTEQPRSLRDYLAIVSRRRKQMIITAATALLAVVLLAVLLPSRYQSTATILIEQQELPADLVRSTVTSYADQRVQVISQRVMTTRNLLDIIQRYDLYADERDSETREALIEQMREDIGLRMISADVIDPRSGLPREATIAFALSFTSPSPAQAVKVANELTTLYLNENITERTRLARDASTFLEEEATRLNAQIAEVETRLAAFKQKHAEALPELAVMNMQLMDRNEIELRAAETRQMALEQQRVYLQAQLAQLKPNSVLLTEGGERVLSTADRLKVLKSSLASARALYGPDHPDIVRMEREVAGLGAEVTPQEAAAGNDLQRSLDAAKADLEQARQKYAPEHPDRLRLERSVTALDAELTAERAKSALTANAAMPTDADNPSYIQVRAQLQATENDLRAMGTQVQRLKAQVAGYARNIALAPQIEKEYFELSRDRQNAQAKYQEIRLKQMEAQVAQNLESGRKGERFSLIEPPLPPEQPVSPNRPLIFILGLLLSVGLAFGVAALLEALDTTVRGRKDLAELLAEPPLALVPHIGTDEDATLARRRWTLAGVSAAVAGIAAIVALHVLYKPVDVVWFIMMRRLGL